MYITAIIDRFDYWEGRISGETRSHCLNQALISGHLCPWPWLQTWNSDAFQPIGTQGDFGAHFSAAVRVVKRKGKEMRGNEMRGSHFHKMMIIMHSCIKGRHT